jgi:hypothetical protein
MIQCISTFHYLGAKLRKISRFGAKKGALTIIFYEKSYFFCFFVVFLITFPYICEGIHEYFNFYYKFLN